jgi:DcuC family C4-dicarboxylate transporter
MTAWIAFSLVIAAGGWMVARRVDVRLPLIMGAFILFAVARDIPTFFAKMIQEMSNPKTVVPICSAMGFAYVCKLTGCDQHLVHFLTRPVAKFRVLMIPLGVLAGYCINMAIVSQSSAAAVLGPVLVPLLLAAKLPPVTAGSILLLGCSMGGELFNPGAVEQARLAELTHLPPITTVRHVMPFNLVASIISLAVFWWLTVRKHSQPVEPSVAEDAPEPSPLAAEEPPPFRINLFKAIIPLLPLMILVVVAVFYKSFIKIPPTFPKDFTGAADVLAAMLIGTVCALLSAPKLAGEGPRAFFEGAGWGYTHVISLIVVATVFMDSISANNLVSQMTSALAGRPALAIFAAMAVPLGLAALCGSGIAPAVAVMKVLIPEAAKLGIDPVRLGALIAVSAQFGRTMSPSAAVALFCGSLTQTSQIDLVKRTAPPLLIGLGVLYLAVVFGLV